MDFDEIPMIMEREAGMGEHVPKVAVGFGLCPHQDEKRSADAGHPVFEDVEYIKIAVPGDKQSLYCQPSKIEDRQRFPQAYSFFKQRSDKPADGFPIEQWPQITRSEALTLRAAHIHTVEALSQVHDGHLDKIGYNARSLREKAAAFLAQAKDTALAQKQAADLRARDDLIEEMQRRINDLAARVEQQGSAGEQDDPVPRKTRKAAA